jgi:hypothetical protein
VNGAKGADSASQVPDAKSEELPVTAPAAPGADQPVEKK